VISPAAFRLHSQGTAISAVRGRPGLVLDEEAVQVCADRVRELRARDANKAREPGPGPLNRIEPGPMGAAGTTRFGERNRQSEAVFRCARCTRLAAIVHVVRAGTTADVGRPAGAQANRFGGCG
jgi:ribosomal protein L37E